MTGNNIIESLKFTYEIADEQKDLFTPAHTLYKCRITTPDRRRYTFNYQCNPAHNTPSKEDCMGCLLSDADAAECCTDEADFLDEYGYIGSADGIRRGIEAYRGCKKTAKALDRLFTSDEKAALYELYGNY